MIIIIIFMTMIIVIIIMIMKKVMMAHIAPRSQCCFGQTGVFLHLFLSPQYVWSTFVTPPPCWWVTQLLQEWASDHDFFQPFLYFVIFCGILCLSYVVNYNLTVVGMSWWPRIFQHFWILGTIFLFSTFIPVKKIFNSCCNVKLCFSFWSILVSWTLECSVAMETFNGLRIRNEHQNIENEI